jgi:GNAT superfamily N-acetyltransferase
MIIRLAKPEDMKAVLELIKELATFEQEPEAVIVTENDLQRDGFSAQPLFRCFVAEIETKIVGIALFYYRYSTWKGKTIHLEDLIVTEKYRGQNIGNLLYKKVLEQAYNEGVKRVEWAVLDWNKTAIDFYEKSGAKVLSDWRVVQMDEKALEKFIKQDNFMNNQQPKTNN